MLDVKTMYILSGIALLLMAFISGALSMGLARHKGYGDGYFWLGFFLGIFGLIYMAGLPEAKNSCVAKSTESTEPKEPGQVCPSCGYEQALPRKKCYKCGTPLDGSIEQNTKTES